MKKLKMLLTLLAVSICSLQSMWAEGEVRVSVSLTNSGSLSQEILTSLANQGLDQSATLVNELTVTSGTFDADDWTTLQTMSSLKVLDLYGISNTELPEQEFNSHCPNLQSISLPRNLTIIGRDAFFGNQNISVITLPGSMETIGDRAFYNMDNLQTINWPASVKEIPTSCFEYCDNLEPFPIPEGVTSVRAYAFNHCYKFASSLPSSLKSIGQSAFESSNMQDVAVVITDDMTIGYNAFSCTNISSIDYASKFYNADNFGNLYNCSNITDVYFRSPTVVIADENSQFLMNANESVTIHVPAYLQAQYNGHKYWSKFTIATFPDTDVDHYIVQDNLTLKGGTRISGTPNLSLNENVELTINGDAAQQFGNFSMFAGDSYSNNPSNYEDWRNYGGVFYYYRKGYYEWSKIISECNNVTISGDLTYQFGMPEKQWRFLSLPFDFKVSDITTEGDVKFAIRYYDGARRAANNASTSNWIDFAEDAFIEAGTGFIIQTSQNTYVTFKAQANNTRNNMFKNTTFSKSLAKNNPSGVTSAHKGWNFVGNPWQSYYNIRKMNYTAPISVYDDYNDRYEAYSPSDDDFALLPNQAFFVQCPDEVESIGFPIDGRQFTDEITSQNGSRASEQDMSRQLFDIRIENGELNDKTRLVLNENALMDYEIGRDANKFIVAGSKTPQIYSLDAEDTQYAINERPVNSGSLRLGIIIATDGQYTLSAIRNAIGQVILTDNETGIKTDLQENNYTFTAKKGTYEQRFTLSFSRGIGGEGTTGIQDIAEPTINTVEVYTLDGTKVSNTTEGLKKGVYVVRQNQKTQKVIIK